MGPDRPNTVIVGSNPSQYMNVCSRFSVLCRKRLCNGMPPPPPRSNVSNGWEGVKAYSGGCSVRRVSSCDWCVPDLDAKSKRITGNTEKDCSSSINWFRKYDIDYVFILIYLFVYINWIRTFRKSSMKKTQQTLTRKETVKLQNYLKHMQV